LTHLAKGNMTTPQSPTRFSWQEMREYWELHAQVRATTDLAADPDALDNVCTPGAPTWLNQYYAEWQQFVYRGLLGTLPSPGPTSRALDVGCGAGRWCRTLAARGYEVTGIDLQPSLISALRERHPTMTFECVPAQELRPVLAFDLVSSVTVIAHNPFDEQERIVEHLRSILANGGHAIVLENVRDHGRHVFSRSESGWVELFEAAGFELINHRRYDYSPCLRLVSRGLALGRAVSGQVVADEPSPASHMARSHGGSASSLRQAVVLARRIARTIDSRIEPELIRRNPRIASGHCGFVFRVT
jgi:SAM-dependent methyltransferase